MTIDSSPTINGHTASRLLVNVPNKGPWYAECDVPVEAAITGRATIKLASLTLEGTIVIEQSGTFGHSNFVRVVAGGAGWGRDIGPHSYHNDAGIKARLLAEDAARECGETLGTFIPTSERVGNSYARNAGSAARTLEAAAGDDAAWWVDYAGVTHVGPRPGVTVPSSAYHVIAYNPRERTVLLGIEDPGVVPIGSIIGDPLDVPGTVRELQLWSEKSELRALAWLGGDDSSHGRLTGLLRSIVERSSDGSLHGCYRYRVVRMAAGSDGRVELQAVRRSAGLPDLAPVTQWPGFAGLHAVLQPGGEVLVQFIDGDRAQPVVTHYAGKGGPGFAPVSIVIGGPDGAPAARQNDAVEVLLSPAVISGTIGVPPATQPITGVLTFTNNKADGVIMAGSAKVRIAP